MKKLIFFIFLLSIGAENLRADEQVAAVQLQLKTQGFYYGSVDGNFGPETGAAISRYQIRNGLKVTGNINKETLATLNVGGGAPAQTSQTAPRSQPTPVQTGHGIAESDRDFLRNQDAPATPPSPAVAPPQQAPQPPPQRDPDPEAAQAPVDAPQQPAVLPSQYIALFHRTPFENAPIDVQQNTVKGAQWRLLREQYYGGAVDGIPGPATAQAIVLFQQASRLPQTGRLDMNTLGALRLLPNVPNGNRVIQPFYPPPPAPYYSGPQPVYRGIWVH